MSEVAFDLVEDNMKSLKEIRGIGPQATKKLIEHGFKDIEAIAGAAVADLAAVPGFSVARAEKTIEAAKVLMSSRQAAPASEKSTELYSQDESISEETEQGEEAEQGEEINKPVKQKKSKKGKKPKKEKKKKKKEKGKKKGKKKKKS